MNTVEEVKQAHLRFIVEIIRWGDIEAAGMTWADMEERLPAWADVENAFFCHKEE